MASDMFKELYMKVLCFEAEENTNRKALLLTHLSTHYLNLHST